MIDDGVIPRATAEKLVTEFPPGTRHKAKIDIAVPLIANGMSPTAVFFQLREKFPDASEKEISNVIDWVVKQNPQPTNGHVNGFRRYPNRNGNDYFSREPEKPKRTPLEHCEWWTSGARCTPVEILESSPTPVPEDRAEQAGLALSCLYAEDDYLNIVTNFLLSKEGKANPSGAGEVMQRDEWVIRFRDHGVSESEAGAWMRINPCAGIGSGSGGAITDEDITDFKFMLLEADHIPIPVQLALFQRLKLSIAAILMSGGASAHAWIKVAQPTAEAYDTTVKRILVALEPFGIDQSNKNESRLSRLPGAVRQIKAVDGGLQRLLWLNPTVAGVTESSLKIFEETLLVPAIEEKPLKSLARGAVARYREMKANAGRLGVPYGIHAMDQETGGMKPGQTIVVAGKTGGGKSTMGLHIVDCALKNNYGVALFSLEMDKEEVFDLMVANRCQVNRNKFNHGRFHEGDFGLIDNRMQEFENLPLYIDDSPMTSADQIRLQVLQLKASGKIHLVVVDYIQFVNPDWTKEVREQQVATISHKLRALARETKLPFVILSQLNDEGKLRESRVIAHNANVVLLVEVTGDVVKIGIKKGRGIAMEDHFLNFNRTYARLEEQSQPTPAPQPLPEPQASLPYPDP